MEFFKSVFSDKPEQSPPSSPNNPHDEDQDQDQEEQERSPDDDAPNSSSGGGPGLWGFGGLIKTIATRSESVIQTYRRDLEEFGSGLRKETAAVREIATRAVRDLPVSLEAGASVAQESLESVGQAIDDLGGSVWRGTAGIISHGREALIALDRPDDDPNPPLTPAAAAASSKRYSRFEALLLAAQSDPATFSEEPEDAEDFDKWKAGFELAEKEEEIEGLLYDNGALEELFEKMVPSVVDYDAFWTRYYYRVYKLKQAEDARLNLVKKAISREEEEEELSWEVDDDEEEVEKKENAVEVVREEEKEQKLEETEGEKEEDVKEKEVVQASEALEEKIPIEMPQIDKLEDPAMSAVSMPLPEEQVQRMVKKAEDARSNNGDELAVKTDGNVPPEAKAEPVDSHKDRDIPVASSQPSVSEEDDLGWDEIEDLGEHDDLKVVGAGASPNMVELCKRLSTADEDEDLSWDIEDDEEPAKL